ncbi:MAG: RES family NAD+ phosphorylase [Candidatus Rokuibacteriota bacterium]
MTRVWRICRRPFAAFDGEGARQAGGRWNRPGVAVVYTSATLSLAALEYFVHLDPGDAPVDLVVVPADIADDVSRRELAAAALPRNWREYPAPAELADLGTAWVHDGASAVLVVPSAIVPQERNVLFNPAHPDFRRVRIGRPEAFSFDPRMWKR